MIPAHEDILQSLISMAAAGTLRGMFSDIPSEVYNDPRCPGIRSGQLKAIVERSYAHFEIAEHKDSEDMKFGRDFHEFILEPDRFEKSQVLASDYLDFLNMKKSLRAHPDAWPRIEMGRKEVTLFSIDPEFGCLKRCRIDALTNRMADLKKCRNASAEAFARDCRKYLYRVSAAHYVQIYYELFGVFIPFDLIACEDSAPYAVAVYEVDQRSLSIGGEECRRALAIMNEVRIHGEKAWKGYPTGVRTLSI